MHDFSFYDNMQDSEPGVKEYSENSLDSWLSVGHSLDVRERGVVLEGFVLAC